MHPIRVLVVDDSVVIRRIVSEVLSGDPRIEVVGSASNGRIALARVPQLVPDLVVLDVEMPEMDGLETLAAIRKTWPKLPVIMYSTITQRGAAATLDALALGANDYVTKPSGHENAAEARARVASDLIPKVHALGSRRAASEPPRTTSVQTTRSSRPMRSRNVELVVIGTSTGGPNALMEVLPRLPAEFPAPVLVVQHMPPLFTGMLAERLDTRCALRVREAEDGDRPTAGGIWIAPGDHHMAVAMSGIDMVLSLNREPPENSCRPAADVLFRAAAATCGSAVLAVVLTGMGEDGLRGSRAIQDRGGNVIAQDEASSVVWGMPGHVARAGIAQQVLPVSEIGSALVQMVTMPRITQFTTR